MIKALRDLGVDIDDGGHWALPFTVRGHGHIRGGEVHIDASASSQFVSGLLLAAPRFDVGLHLVHTGERLPSTPHIDMTIEALSHRGVRVERPSPNEWVVAAGPIRAKHVAIEPDLSNAAPFLAAAMVVGGSVTVTSWPAHSTQPGALLGEILALMGARVTRRGGAFTVTGGRGIAGIDLDLSAAGEQRGTQERPGVRQAGFDVDVDRPDRLRRDDPHPGLRFLHDHATRSEALDGHADVGQARQPLSRVAQRQPVAETRGGEQQTGHELARCRRVDREFATDHLTPAVHRERHRAAAVVAHLHTESAQRLDRRAHRPQSCVGISIDARRAES